MSIPRAGEPFNALGGDPEDLDPGKGFQEEGNLLEGEEEKGGGEELTQEGGGGENRVLEGGVHGDSRQGMEDVACDPLPERGVLIGASGGGRREGGEQQLLDKEVRLEWGLQEETPEPPRGGEAVEEN